MPFYEYQCKSCGHDLEAMQKVMDPPLKKCPHCGKSQLQRLMSAPVFRLKGGGWYETDFKGDQDNKRNLADRPDEAPKETATDGAKDAAPKDAAKNGAPAAADGTGKEGKTEVAPAKDAAPNDKKADTRAEKSGAQAAQAAKKPSAAKSASRGRTVSHGKSAAKRPIKRPVHKAKRRV